MDYLRFAHQFFHFSLPQWLDLSGPSSPPAAVARLFQEEIFPRRALKSGAVGSLAQAEEIFLRILAREKDYGIRSLAQDSPLYPEALLRHLPPERRPLFLHLRGADLPPESQAVGVVGTRHPSASGKSSATAFSAYLSMLGIKVVSGLAKGIDAIAHQENLRQGTVAVLGGGVAGVYPRENEGLAEAILSHGGTLASPFPLGQVPLPHNFPQRNELIAALAAGILVIEGRETSGAAVTGKQSLAMGKCVVALTQDYRTDFGRGAIRLQQCGAELAATEEEAVGLLFSRLGGYGKLPLPAKRRAVFTLQEFMTAAGLNLPEALVLLEEGLSCGRLERVGEDRYRRRKAVDNAKR
jgi:DNA processing protein